MNAPTHLTECQPEQISALPTRKRERQQLLKRFPGVLAIVADRHGVRRASVSQVFNGLAKSSKLEAALLAEFNKRMKAELTTDCPRSNAA